MPKKTRDSLVRQYNQDKKKISSFLSEQNTIRSADNVEAVRGVIEDIEHRIDMFAEMTNTKGWDSLIEWINHSSQRLNDKLHDLPHSLDNSFERSNIVGEMKGLAEIPRYINCLIEYLENYKTREKQLVDNGFGVDSV